MTTSNRVLILGAGAMGAAYASRFYALDPACVALVARGERGARLKREGLVVNGETLKLPVLAPGDPGPPADLIIVALKHQHLAEAVDDLTDWVGDHTLILSVMNGLDSENILSAVYGSNKVLYCIAVGIDAQRQGHIVNYSKVGRLLFGEATNATLTTRVVRVQEMLNAANIPNETPPDMIRMLWWKFMINVGINQASAVLRAPYGVFQTSPHAQAIMEAAMREVITLAQAAGVGLAEDDIAGWYMVLNTLHPEGATSMLQDVDAGRLTEVDIFAGKVVVLGEALSIPTPVNTLLLHAIKVIEQGAQG